MKQAIWVLSATIVWIFGSIKVSHILEPMSWSEYVVFLIVMVILQLIVLITGDRLIEVSEQ